MDSESLIRNRNPQGPSDPLLDRMLRESLAQPQPTVVIQQQEESVRDYAIRHDFPVPQPERFQWRRCLVVTLCAVLGTLLLGQGLERALRLGCKRPWAQN